MIDNEETQPGAEKFDVSEYPADTLFHERRTNRPRRKDDRRPAGAETPRNPNDRRQKKERRRRVDPTTFEKQYTLDELEFMNAMQQFKVQMGKSFPSHGDVLRIAHSLGYRRNAAPAGSEAGGAGPPAGADDEAP